MNERPDEENLNNLLQDIADVRHGKIWPVITIHQGWIVGYEIEKTVKGSKAPLKKVKDGQL